MSHQLYYEIKSLFLLSMILPIILNQDSDMKVQTFILFFPLHNTNQQHLVTDCNVKKNS